MNERPVILSRPEVRELLAHGEAQLRRSVRPGPVALQVTWKPGDRLWAREDFCTRQDGPAIKVRYRADGDQGQARFVLIDVAGKRYATERYVSRKAKHCPRWASRLVVEVLVVREEGGVQIAKCKLQSAN